MTVADHKHSYGGLMQKHMAVQGELDVSLLTALFAFVDRLVDSICRSVCGSLLR